LARRIRCANRPGGYGAPVSTFRVRKPYVLLEAFLVPSAVAVLLLLLVRPFVLALPAVLVLLAFGTWSMLRASRRALTLTDDGLRLQRDAYRLEVPWHMVVGVDRGRRRGLLRADELVLADSKIVALDHRNETTRLPKGLQGHPATSRVQVSLYDPDWASGPIGEHLRARGIPI
jgi:hypothetical protein